MELEYTPPTKFSNKKYWIAFGILYVVALLVGGPLGTFASTGLQVLPFLPLVILAGYAQRRGGSWKVASATYWVVLNCAIALVLLLLLFVVVFRADNPGFDSNVPPESVSFASWWRLVLSGLGFLLAGILGAVCFHPVVRRLAAAWIPIEPGSFVHATALATTVALTGMCFVPLVVLSEPLLGPLMRYLVSVEGVQLNPTLSTIYGLTWSIPVSFVAVGYGQHRSFAQALDRLGLTKPSLLQLGAVVVATGGLLLLMKGLDFAIVELFRFMDWPTTDANAVTWLIDPRSGAIGMIALGLAAGVSEEITFRGVLQPRIGVVLTALLFTSSHALQYNADALLQVFLFAVAAGLLRKRTNTTTSILVHVLYDWTILALS